MRYPRDTENIEVIGRRNRKKASLFITVIRRVCRQKQIGSYYASRLNIAPSSLQSSIRVSALEGTKQGTEVHEEGVRHVNVRGDGEGGPVW